MSNILKQMMQSVIEQFQPSSPQSELEEAWGHYEKAKQNWQQIKYDAAPKKRLKAIGKMAEELPLVEMQMTELFLDESGEMVGGQRDVCRNEVQRLYRALSETDRLFVKEGKKEGSVWNRSDLFPSQREFQLYYQEEKAAFLREKNEEHLYDLYHLVVDFTDEIIEKYENNRVLCGDDCHLYFDEAIAVLFQAMDEVEALGKELPQVQLDKDIAELYDAMNANGLFSPEELARHSHD